MSWLRCRLNRLVAVEPASLATAADGPSPHLTVPVHGEFLLTSLKIITMHDVLTAAV
jgi:hypothetical protein